MEEREEKHKPEGRNPNRRAGRDLGRGKGKGNEQASVGEEATRRVSPNTNSAETVIGPTSKRPKEREGDKDKGVAGWGEREDRRPKKLSDRSL